MRGSSVDSLAGLECFRPAHVQGQWWLTTHKNYGSSLHNPVAPKRSRVRTRLVPRLCFHPLLDIPPELVRRLRDEIVEAYHPGHTPEERNAIAHRTACPQMVAQCEAEWRHRSRSQPLTQLLGIVADAMNQLFKDIDNARSFCPPQIAVRENVSDVQFGPHVDGLSDSVNTQQPDVPFAVVGVYLDNVKTRSEGALVYWPAKAPDVRAAMTSGLTGPALATALCAISGSCNFADPAAQPVIGAAGHGYFVGGNVPHCNHSRSTDGKRVAVYFRMYLNTASS